MNPQPSLRRLAHLPTRVMRTLTRHRNLGMIERMAADAVLVNLALIGAFALRSLVRIWFTRGDQGVTQSQFLANLLHGSVAAFATAAPLLTVLCLVVFYLGGFYTHGRAYRGRYKALIIFQSVTIAYGIFAIIGYLLLNMTSLTPWFPRSVWLGGWVLTLLLVGGVRIWSKLWRSVQWTEARVNETPAKKAIHNVLVIGGAGYVGSVLVRRLLDYGYNVTVMDAFIYGNEGLRDCFYRRGFQVIEGDLRDIEGIIRALQYTDAVVHLGGLVGDPACALDEQLTLEVNLASTRLIAEAARGFGVQRFIFASSCSVYGASNEILNERSVLDPVSLYAKTKLESERVLLDLEDLHFSPIILRFGTFYGLSPRARFDLVVNLLTAKAVSEKSISILGGKQWRPLIHVEDGADAMLKCLQAPLHAVKGEIFNVGSDEENYQIGQIGDLVKEAVPDIEVLRLDDLSAGANYRVSFAKIRKYLGFTTHYTVTDGIAEIKNALEMGFIPQYQDSAYSNHKRLAEDDSGLSLRRNGITPLYALNREEDRSSA